MKKRIMLSVLVIALAAALIAGATQAWFTDEKDLPVAEFTAGTLEIDVSEGEPFILALENRVFENTNPGDCATIVWNIENIGTKRAEIRVKIDSEWLRQTSADTWAKFEPDIDPELDYEGRAAFFAPKGDEWVMYEDEEGMWLYYTGNALLGSYDIEKGEEGENSVQLCLVVGFDGPNMDNQYQGKKFKISGEVQAVQTTNGAPEAVWGIDSLEAIKEGEAEGIYVEEYFTEGERGYDMPCWEGEGGDEPQDPSDPEYKWVLTGTKDGSGTGFISVADDKVQGPGQGQGQWFRKQNITLPNEDESIDIGIVCGNPEKVDGPDIVGQINIKNIGENKYRVTFNYNKVFPDNPSEGQICKIIEIRDEIRWNIGEDITFQIGNNKEGSLDGFEFISEEKNIEFFVHFGNIIIETYECRIKD